MAAVLLLVAAGLGVSAATGGKQVSITAGTTLEFTLTDNADLPVVQYAPSPTPESVSPQTTRERPEGKGSTRGKRGSPGRLTGTAVEQLRKVCDPIKGPLALDLSSLMFADDAGIDVIREMSARKVALRGDSPFIQLLLDDTAGSRNNWTKTEEV